MSLTTSTSAVEGRLFRFNRLSLVGSKWFAGLACRCNSNSFPAKTTQWQQQCFSQQCQQQCCCSSVTSCADKNAQVILCTMEPMHSMQCLFFCGLQVNLSISLAV